MESVGYGERERRRERGREGREKGPEWCLILTLSILEKPWR